MPLFLLFAWALGPCAPALAVGWIEEPERTLESIFSGQARLQGLLQRVVDKLYLKAFRHLGDERDFDHGHILFDKAKRPVAILYHTQETAYSNPTDSSFGYIDPKARNWIQWIGRDEIENADRYQRKEFPRSASWEWFQARRLPNLIKHHTIIDKMLDPNLVDMDDAASSLQWVFTRVPCGKSKPFSVVLPTGEKVCLSLSLS